MKKKPKQFQLTFPLHCIALLINCDSKKEKQKKTYAQRPRFFLEVQRIHIVKCMKCIFSNLHDYRACGT